MSQLAATQTDPDRAASGLYRLPPHLLWPGLVVALLVGQIVVCFVMISRAVGDPTVAIEPNYYQKAVNWDTNRAALDASAALGWTATWDVADVADVVGERLVKLTLTDDAGAAITDAEAEVRFFHHARSADRRTATLTHGGGGIYAAALPMGASGVWTLDIRATRGDDVYLQSSELRIAGLGRTKP